MGLDVTSYERAELVHTREECDDYDDCWDEGLTQVYIHPQWPERAASLVNGCYRTFGEEVDVGNSYSGHSSFRSLLSFHTTLVKPEDVWTDPDSYQYRPFFELIHFSDCEGTLDWQVCRELQKDLDEHYDRLVPIFEEAYPMWQPNPFERWAEAIRNVKPTGFISFH